MKKTKRICALVLAALAAMIFCGCFGHNNDTETCLLRLHVRANSNDPADQAVKLRVRDAISDCLSGALAGADDFDEAYAAVSAAIPDLVRVAEETLEKNGFSYGARVRLCNEYFPARAYEDIVVESGYYDALIVELGSGKGDNWWCVIYPPLCFVRSDTAGGVKYRSIIKELWERFVSGK